MEIFKDVPIDKYKEILESKTRKELIDIALNQIIREKKRIAGNRVSDKILKKVREEPPSNELLNN